MIDRIRLDIKTNVIKIKERDMSVFVKGHGKDSIVLMAGSSQVSPILEFKSLINELQKSFKVIVVEKFGYGFSDIVREKRTTDIILEETREALSKLGLQGPFILCPYSLSGLEALLWAQKYPEEIKTIVGVDMAFPYHYKHMHTFARTIILYILRLFVKLGITYIIPDHVINKLIPYDLLTTEEKKIYRFLLRKNFVNFDVINEGAVMKENLKLFKDDVRAVPSLLFASTGNSTGFATNIWRYPHEQYIKENSKSRLIYYDCGHELPFIMFKEMYGEIENFVSTIEQQ